MRRCALLYLGRYPAAARTSQETTSLINKRRFNEQQKIVVRDVNKQVLGKLNAQERLDFANTGNLPERYILKGPLDE